MFTEILSHVGKISYFSNCSPLNLQGKCREKSCKLSEHANDLNLFYVTFLSMEESCVQSKCVN